MACSFKSANNPLACILLSLSSCKWLPKWCSGFESLPHSPLLPHVPTPALRPSIPLSCSCRCVVETSRTDKGQAEMLSIVVKTTASYTVKRPLAVMTFRARQPPPPPSCLPLPRAHQLSPVCEEVEESWGKVGHIWTFWPWEGKLEKGKKKKETRGHPYYIVQSPFKETAGTVPSAEIRGWGGVNAKQTIRSV